MQERFSDSREAVSTLRAVSTLQAVTHFLERKDWYLCFARGPLKKMLGNFTRDFCEVIEVQRRVFQNKNKGWKMRKIEKVYKEMLAF